MKCGIGLASQRTAFLSLTPWLRWAMGEAVLCLWNHGVENGCFWSASQASWDMHRHTERNWGLICSLILVILFIALTMKVSSPAIPKAVSFLSKILHCPMQQCHPGPQSWPVLGVASGMHAGSRWAFCRWAEDKGLLIQLSDLGSLLMPGLLCLPKLRWNTSLLLLKPQQWFLTFP